MAVVYTAKHTFHLGNYLASVSAEEDKISILLNHTIFARIFYDLVIPPAFPQSLQLHMFKISRF